MLVDLSMAGLALVLSLRKLLCSVRRFKPGNYLSLWSLHVFFLPVWIPKDMLMNRLRCPYCKCE